MTNPSFQLSGSNKLKTVCLPPITPVDLDKRSRARMFSAHPERPALTESRTTSGKAHTAKVPKVEVIRLIAPMPPSCRTKKNHTYEKGSFHLFAGPKEFLSSSS